MLSVTRNMAWYIWCIGHRNVATPVSVTSQSANSFMIRSLAWPNANHLLHGDWASSIPGQHLAFGMINYSLLVKRCRMHMATVNCCIKDRFWCSQHKTFNECKILRSFGSLIRISRRQYFKIVAYIKILSPDPFDSCQTSERRWCLK